MTRATLVAYRCQTPAPAVPAVSSSLQQNLRARAAFVLACSLTLLGSTPPVAAQHRFDSWTTENGLPQNSVNDILQTRDGYLWLATHGGLVRFDGTRFVVFDKTVHGIGSTRLRVLHEDRAGALWIGSEDGMLTRFQHGVFTTFGAAEGLPHAGAVRIEEDEAGTLWVTWVGRVTHYDGARFVTYTADDFTHGVKAPPPIRYWDAWWNAEGGRLHALVMGQVRTYDLGGALGPRTVTGVSLGRRGTLWISTSDGGVIKAPRDQPPRLATSGGLPANRLFFEGHDGELWFSDDRGVHRLRDGVAERMLPPAPPSSLRSVYVDREGSTWLGTTANGVHRLRDVPVTLYDERDGVSLRGAYAVLEDRAGTIWVSTSGLHRYAGGKLTTVSAADALSADRVTAFYEDRAGTLWVGTSGGLAYLRNGRLQRSPDDADGLLAAVWAIAQDRAGTMWFATDGGLVSRHDRRLTRYTSRDGLPHDRVTALFEDRAGALWVGTWRGLARRADGALTAFGERDGFTDSAVRAFHEDADGALWIGTYDAGLFRLAGGRFTRYTKADGLHDNGIFQILEDAQGFLWMGSNRGIQRLARRELNEFAEGRRRVVTAIALGARDGLASVEVNGGVQPAGLARADGTLWFPTMGGVAVIDPLRVHHNGRPPAPMIEEFSLAGRPLDFARGVRVDYDAPVFSIRYTSPTFVRPDQVRFRHRLAGLHHEWIDAGTDREATFYSVPPGRYSFEVMAAGQSGEWSPAGAPVLVTVLAPFWRTWWFVGVAMLAALAVAGAAHDFRMRRLRALQGVQQAFSQQLIDSQERERRRISSEMHDSLGQELRIIKKLARMGRDGDGERAPLLDEIATLADRVQSEMTAVAYGLRPHQLDTIGLSKTIDSMIRRVSQACDIQFATEISPIDELVPVDAHIHVFRIVQEGVSNIVAHSRATHARVAIAKQGRTIHITIEDNGTGIETPAAAAAPTTDGGFGLVGIRERARILGGRVEIRSRNGIGTTLLVVLPGEPADHV